MHDADDSLVVRLELQDDPLTEEEITMFLDRFSLERTESILYLCSTGEELWNPEAKKSYFAIACSEAEAKALILPYGEFGSYRASSLE
ncbi:hypothetical protein JW711_01955 [Candidatus Woesearchaeota archaeon]|nr:hypothetical protein [Candidatus Woesearchaeota archaeon]